MKTRMELDEVQQAGEEISEIYLRNVFPDMRVSWGTHPNNLGTMIRRAASAAMTAATPVPMGDDHQ